MLRRAAAGVQEMMSSRGAMSTLTACPGYLIGNPRNDKDESKMKRNKSKCPAVRFGAGPPADC